MKRSLKNFGNAQDRLSNYKLREIKGGNNDVAGTYTGKPADSEDPITPSNGLLTGGNNGSSITDNSGTSKDKPTGRADLGED